MSKLIQIIEESINKVIANKFAESIWGSYNVQNNFELISSGGQTSANTEHWAIFFDNKQKKYFGYKVTGINPKQTLEPPLVVDSSEMKSAIKKLNVKM